MDRLIKKTVILAEVEATRYTDAAPTGADNAVRAFDMAITYLDAQAVEIPYIAAYLGASALLQGAAPIKCSFSVALSASGTAGTAPALGTLLLACAMSESSGLTSPARVEYLPASDDLQTVTLYWYDDGALHKALGVIGNAKLSAKGGESAKITYDFLGLDGGISAATNVSQTLTAWKDPVPLTKANVTDITIGGTFSAGAVTGGTTYNSTGLTLDFANELGFAALLNQEKTVLKDRKVVGTTSLELTAAQEVSLAADVVAGTKRSVAFTIGKTTGAKCLIWLPSARFTKPKKEEFEGLRMIGYDLRAEPVSGNDEARLVFL
jgi:hypothetical protein